MLFRHKKGWTDRFHNIDMKCPGRGKSIATGNKLAGCWGLEGVRNWEWLLMDTGSLSGIIKMF